MNPLDIALIDAWQAHVPPRLQTPTGRAQLAARLTTPTRLAADAKRPTATARHLPHDKPLRAFALVLRANDRRLPDRNTAGTVCLDPDTLEKCCAPIHLPPPGLPRAATARTLGISPQALTARVRNGQLIKHQPHPTQRRPRRHPSEPPMSNVYYHAPPPHHLVDPVGDVQSADWGGLNQNLHTRPRNLPPNPTPSSACGLQSACASQNTGTWSQTLHRTVRQLRPQNPTPQYERFEWQCPDCSQLAQRLYWPFRPMTLPAYLNFDFQQLAPELPPEWIEKLSHHQSKISNPYTPGFTCRKCLQQQFGGRGLTYESSEFTSHNGKNIPKNTWHLFIQRLTMNLLHGHEVPPPAPV